MPFCRTLATIKEFSEKLSLLPRIKAIRDEDNGSVVTLDDIAGTVGGMPKMEPGEGTLEGTARRMAVYTTLRDLIDNRLAFLESLCEQC